MKVNTGALLKIANGGFTNPSATITNLGKINIANSSSVSNIISSTYPGVTGVTTVTNQFTEMSGSGIIANSGSQTIYLDGLISGGNKVSMEGSSASSSIYLTRSNSFTGGIDFAGPAATNNNGTVWFLNSNSLGSGPIINSINSSNAQVKTYTPAGGSVQNWILTNTVNTGTANTAVMAFGAGTSNSLTLAGKVSGAGQLKVTSSDVGELRVANMDNDYTGGTEVGTGAIVISNAAALGTGPVNFGTGTNSILKVTDTTTLANTMTISGISGTSSSTTPYTAYINVSANKTFTNSGGLNNKLSVGTTTNDQKYGGNLVKQGAGSAVLSGVNGYSGSTTINNGTLTLSGATLNTPLVSLVGSSNAVLKLMSTGVLSSSVNFTGDNSSANTGTVNFNAAGSYTFNRYGDSAANPGLNMNFTNSSSGAVTATFTNGTNYITDPTGSGGGKTIWNRSTNLTLVFSGAMEVGSTADNNFGLSGDGSFTLNGSVTNSGTGIRALTKAGAGKATLNAVNSYNGTTTVSGGTLEVGAAGALPVTSAVIVSNGATLRFNKSSGDISVGALTVTGNLEQNLVTIISSGAVDLTESTLTVNGTPTDLSYTLIEGTSLTGIPTLSTEIDGYELNVDSTSVKLVKTVVVIGSTFDTTYPVGSEETVGPNGLKNLMNYALGGTALNPSPELPVLTIDANGLTLTANIRNDDSNLNLPEKVVGQWAISLEGPWTDVPLTPTGSASAVPNTTTKSFTQSVESSQPRKFLRFKVSK
jgi:autotransporter-associated beta strand protein